MGAHRSLHPVHRTFVRTEEDGLKIDFIPRCSCQPAQIGDTIRLSAGCRPRDRDAAFRSAIGALKVHERSHGIA